MFPTPHKVLHTETIIVGENAAGQPLTEERTRERWVSSLRKRVNDADMPVDLNGRVIVEYSMATPESDWTHGDLVEDAHGRRFTVHGDVEDYNLGPFGFKPGYIVILREVVNRGPAGIPVQ
ncbi:head-to-tail stopper [Mycobacterium phage Paola]|uniref:Head-to-tail stopper n=2 Tax=Kratiovirus TaxID=2948788 RepID=A0A345M941_9CAUD|nr:head-tail adaptor [Mycobacterium phage OkiRoe]YP_009950819.1 head-tail adaptor [Mycobacterium phage Paola]YP_009951002.1 head-tail adaptor [Mycobacterium phage Thyatira]AOQ28877.1 head-to-tail stopper [Mycobacterium phage Waterfoul]ASR85802.1 head-to-tail stopper [Mycobacterium phage Guillsminger]AHZ95574.1 head-to-tail stopper [Mycobacterium phage OkiRoe]AVO25804.1 head-to-tail stopper [Mycobacterium phage Paola]AXH67012.1 head-to-tail stopper [Mycobacterium phage Thyatira]